MRYLVVGLLIFSCAFILSFPHELTVLYETYDLVDILRGNPQGYMYFVREILLYLVLPPAVGIGFILIEYIKERKTFLRWELALAGSLIAFSGLNGLWLAHGAYTEIINWYEQYPSYATPIGNLLTLYTTLSIAKILWLFAGVLCIHPYVYKKLHDSWTKHKAR
jgi:hypothetical protein